MAVITLLVCMGFVLSRYVNWRRSCDGSRHSLYMYAPADTSSQSSRNHDARPISKLSHQPVLTELEDASPILTADEIDRAASALSSFPDHLQQPALPLPRL